MRASTNTNGPGIVCRPAVEREVEPIATLSQRAPAYLRDRLRAGDLYVAEHAGRLSGAAVVAMLWGRIPLLELVVVRSDDRRRGVGSALLQFSVGRARDGGAQMLLSSVTAGERGPMAWHVAMGFSECGELSGLEGQGTSEVFFRLELTD